MAEIPLHIKQSLAEYVHTLSQEIHIRSAIVFGSYATGKWTPDSDIDLAIFSDDFTAMDRVEAITFLLNRTSPDHLDIQPLAFDGQDLQHAADNPFLQEILTTGIQIA
jgi:predicted nucleotidyltransferase